MNDRLTSVVTLDHVVRPLGLVPSAIHCPGLLSAVPTLAAPLVPDSELGEYDDWPIPLQVMNQGSWNACTYFASAQALLYGRYQSGQPFISLDPFYPYLLATGGRNVGTNLIEAASRISQYGIPPVKDAAASQARDALRFRFEFCEQITAYDQVLSEVARRRAVVASVCVGQAWMAVDAEGVPGVTRGQANHAIFLGGGLVKSRRHGWMAKHCGSWGQIWGLNGFGWFTEEHYDNSSYNEAYTVQGVLEDLADNDNPPQVTT